MEFKPKDVVVRRNMDSILKDSVYMQNLNDEISNNLAGKVNTVELNKYQLKGDYITTTKAADTYQPIGEYIIRTELDNYTPISEMIDYVKHGDLVNVTDNINQLLSKKANIDKLSEYQLKGDYVTVSSLVSKLDKEDAKTIYQPKGDYATTSDLVKYVPLSDMVGYVKQGDLVKSNDDIRLDLSKKADKTELSNLQPKGEYINLEGLEEKLSEIKLEDTAINVIAKDKKLSEVLVDLENTDKLLSEKQGTIQVELNGKALEIHKHITSDITGLDELIASTELKDTAIDVVAEEKKLNVVLSELRSKDIEQSADILNLKNELNGYVARHKVANDNIQKSIND